MTKKFASMFLALAMCLPLAAPAWAKESGSISSNEDETHAEMISSSVLEQIYESHSHDSCMQVVSTLSNISVDEIYEEISHIYLDIEEAQRKYNESKLDADYRTLSSLVKRKDELEQELVAQGHIFLSNAEVDILFGNGVSPCLNGPEKPADTANHKYTLSPVISLIENGKYLKYFYVTAIPQTTKSGLHTSYVLDILNSTPCKDLWAAFVEIEVSKGIGMVLGKWSFVPYELLSFTPNQTAKSDVQIRASYTSTARFVWMSSPGNANDSFLYSHEGTFHSTSVSEVRTVVTVQNGTTITDTSQKDYTAESEHFSTNKIGQFVHDHFVNGEDGTFILEINVFEYYYVPDKNKPEEKILCKRVSGPYDPHPWVSDFEYGLN